MTYAPTTEADINPNPSGLCMCGCGGRTRIATKTDRHQGRVKNCPLRFLPGHVNRVLRLVPLIENRGYETPCWIWPGKVNHTGYGRGCTGKGAHREAYERVHGPLAKGLEIDHLCRIRPCVNPDHMEAITKAEHSRRTALADAESKAHRSPLTARRVVLGLTQADLGKRLGVRGSKVSQWELGQRRIPSWLDLETLTRRDAA